MIPLIRRGFAVFGVATALLVAACTAPPGPNQTAAPSAVDSPSVSGTATPVAPPSLAASPVAEPPESANGGLSAELIEPGTLAICSSFPRTRFAERDADGDPFGVDVEIGQALAEEMGLEEDIVDVPFEELIDAVVARQCDVSIAGQFITQDRLERIGMVPYREGAPNVIVAEGNPLGIDTPVDLCGRSFGVVAATVYADMVRGAGDYVGQGINDLCLDAGIAPVDLREFPDQQQAEAALSAGDLDAYAGNEALVVERPGEFDLTFELPRARNGIGHRLDASTLDSELREALRSIIADGTYIAILEQYGAAGAALTITP